MSDLLLKDDMTPKERIEAMTHGRPFDRVPCNIFIGDHAATIIGAKVSDLNFSSEKFLYGQLAANKKYGIESTGVSPGLAGIAEALGSKLVFPDHGAPYVREYGIKDILDLERLSIPDPVKAGRFAFVLETAEKLVDEFGREIPVSVEVPGPFTSAGNLMNIGKILRDTRKNPEFVHRILRLVTDTTIAFIKQASKLDVSIGIAEPSASGTLISHGMFETFALPYLIEIVDTIKALGKGSPYLHICGNTKKIWTLMADTGAGALSLDDVIDLEDAKKTVGDRVILIGNVKPTATMYLGKPIDVERDAKECLKKSYDNPKGYVLALGCGFPIDTPPENIHALRGAAIKYGKYPYEPELFS
ncbi:uroporphyrinogen decarboxylase family protein [Clostridium tagluense]|uniref:uroporphyrinogen decarboxylase family protein n=1 Tax=Clostridium tagluense TaxID=360422 RepID=UPI001C0E8E24|nr:uroporphyrinogen decarboxylase family protein [Clostridium tagluense]MBU3129208.1 uroporphyrinogen decarboxylase family protein [Clostridium tagluense]